VSKLLKLIGYAIATLVGLSILTVIALYLISDEAYKRWIAHAVTSTTGRELIIAGDFNLDLGTTLRLKATDVSLANVEWASRPTMFEVKRIESEVTLWPLLNGVLDLVLSVDSGELVLETDATGRGNWEFELAESVDTPRRERTALQLIAREIEMNDVRVSFIRGDSHIEHKAELDKVRLGTRNDRLRATLDGQIEDQVLNLSVDVGNVEQVKSGTANARLNGQVGDMSLTALGTVGQLDDRAGPQLDLALLLKAPHLRSLQVFVPNPLPELGPIDVSGRLKGSAGVYAAEDVRAQLSGESTSLLIEGDISDVMAMDGMGLRVDGATHELPEIVKALGLNLPIGVPQSIEGRAALSGNKANLAVTDAQLTVRDRDAEAILVGEMDNVFAQDGLRAHVEATAASLAALSKYAGRELPKTGPLNASATLNSSDATYELSGMELSLEGEVMDATVDGSIANLFALTGINMDLKGRIRSLADFSKLLDRKLPETTPLEVSAQFTADQGAAGPGRVIASVKGDWLNADADGHIGALRGFKDVDTDVSLTLDSLGPVGALLGEPLPDIGPVNASGHIRSSGDAYALTDVKASIEDKELTAHVTGSIADLLAVKGIDMEVDGHVGSLKQFSGLAGRELPDTKPIELHARVAAAEGAKGAAKVDAVLKGEWIETRFNGQVGDLRGLKEIDADLLVNVKSLAPVADLAGTSLPDLGPAMLSGHIRSSGDAYALTDIKASIEDKELTAKMTGSITDLMAAKGIDMEVDGRIGSLAYFSEFVKTPLPDLGPVEISGHVERTAAAYELADIKASIEDEQLTAQVTGSIADLLAAKGIDMEVDGRIGSLAYFSEFVKMPLPDLGPVEVSGHVERTAAAYELSDIDAHIADENLEAHLKGTIADLLAIKGVNLALTGKTPSLARLSDLVNTQLPDTGPFQLEASVQAKSGLAQPVVLSVRATSESLNGSIVGSVPNLKAVDGLDVTLSLEASKLEDIGKLAGAKLSQAGPVKANAKLMSSAGQVTVDALEIVVGNSNVDGSLKFVPKTDDSNSESTIQGHLSSKFIDLNEILGIELTTGNKTETGEIPESTTVEEEEKTTIKPSERLFPNDPLPLDLLQRYTVNVALDTKRLRLQHANFDDVSAAITLQNGRLQTEVSEARVGDRPVDASLLLDASVEPVALTLKINLDEVPLPPISELDAVLQGGELLLRVDVEGQGGSIREIMGSLNGQALFAFRDARTPNNSLDRFGAGIVTSVINPFEKDEQFTTLHCGASYLEITDGIAHTRRGFAVQLTKVTWLGSGKVNLKTEEIDIRATPKARKGLFGAGTLAKMLQLRGTLTNPQLVTDPVGLVKSGANVALAFATGGVTLLFEGFFSIFRANTHICKRIEKEIVEQPQPATGAEGHK